MNLRRVHVLSALAATLAVAACVNAGGDVEGGEPRFDASPPPGPTPAGGCTGEDGAGTGTTWTDLYADFFGPTGKASCAGDGACHGDASQPGAKASGGFVCADKDLCRATMLDPSRLVAPKDFTAPETSYLVSIIRRCGPSGNVTGTMPKRPQFVFSAKSIDRIQTWIRTGAPND